MVLTCAVRDYLLHARNPHPSPTPTFRPPPNSPRPSRRRAHSARHLLHGHLHHYLLRRLWVLHILLDLRGQALPVGKRKILAKCKSPYLSKDLTQNHTRAEPNPPRSASRGRLLLVGSRRRRIVGGSGGRHVVLLACSSVRGHTLRSVRELEPSSTARSRASKSQWLASRPACRSTSAFIYTYRVVGRRRRHRIRRGRLLGQRRTRDRHRHGRCDRFNGRTHHLLLIRACMQWERCRLARVGANLHAHFMCKALLRSPNTPACLPCTARHLMEAREGRARAAFPNPRGAVVREHNILTIVADL